MGEGHRVKADGLMTSARCRGRANPEIQSIRLSLALPSRRRVQLRDLWLQTPLGYHVRMTSEQYQRWTAGPRVRPRLLHALLALNSAFRYLGYLMYALLLVLVAAFNTPELPQYVLVPFVSFVVLSIVRRIIDEPRPYEQLDIDPLIRKGTRGKSMPSRHIFSMFMIAMGWLAFWPPMGWTLLVIGVLLAVIRVLGGVHFPRDVMVGALCGIIAGLLGFWAW